MLYPWVINPRARLQDDGDPHANEYLNCQQCCLNDAAKARWRCAWVPEAERTGKVGHVPGEYPHEYPDVCGGYLVSLPQVIEAARAASWRKDGALREFYGGEKLTDLTIDCIDIISASTREVENFNIREAYKSKG